MIRGLALLLLLGAAAAQETDFDKGMELLHEGEFHAAAKRIIPNAKRGDPVVQYVSALLTRGGFGTPRDMSQARFWAKKAAEHAFPQAIKSRTDLTRQPVRHPGEVQHFQSRAGLAVAGLWAASAPLLQQLTPENLPACKRQGISCSAAFRIDAKGSGIARCQDY